MVETMGLCDTAKESIEKLISVRNINFPEQPINWGYLLDQFAFFSPILLPVYLFRDRMQFLVTCCMSERVEALAFKVWRDCIFNMIRTADYWARRPLFPPNGELAGN